MQILLLGKNGQLGWELQRTLATLGKVVALDVPEIDFTKVDDLRRIVDQTQPQAIVNAAAYTAVDRAESEAGISQTINAVAPGILAEAARLVKAVFIHYSTDYVFDGGKEAPYTEQDLPNPLNVYGQTKLEGEQAALQAGGAVLVFRTSWVFSNRQGGFVTKVLEWSRQQKILRMVTDQVSGPTWARSLAEATGQVLARSLPEPMGWIQERSGLYHLAGDGYASRLEWAQAILKCDPRAEEQIVEEIQPALTQDFPTPARRPLFSALDCRAFQETFGIGLPHWREALSLAMQPG